MTSSLQADQPALVDRLDLAERAARSGGSVTEAVDIARELGPTVDLPGHGHTARRWAVLTTLARADLSVARVAEAHLDALAILAESGEGIDGDGTWGVYAAEGPGVRVDATADGEGWRLSGTKPWCSAASHLDRALVTAHTPDGGRRLFAVDLRGPGVTTDYDGWVARGLAEVVSGPVVFTDHPATPVGETGWYLTRPGFAWGGIGVSACWQGGLLGLATALWAAAQRRPPDQLMLMHLGAVDLQVQTGRLALAEAAQRVDSGAADGADGVVLAERVRGTVAAAVDAVVGSVSHALGPAPLALDEDHARRAADLQLYVRQHHAERDSARLGGLLLEQDGPPW